MESRDPVTVPIDPGQTAQWEREEVFSGFWEELAAMDPREVCKRAMVSYSEADEVYQARLLDQTFRVSPAGRTIVPDDQASRPDRIPPAQSFIEALILVVYLLKARDIPLSARKVTGKELPGGNLFFRGPHELTCEPILSRYGKDPDAFVRAGIALQGRRIQAGNAGIRLHVLPRIPLEYVLWAGDDEFPASLTIVFDASVSDHLPLDAIWAAAHFVAMRLVEVHV